MEGSKKKKILMAVSCLSLLVFFIGWQLIVDLRIVPASLLASPVQVIKAFIYKLTSADPDGFTLGLHILVSLQEALIGYALALVIGIPLGLAMGWFNVAEGLIRPIFEIIRPIPPVAWIPMAIFLFGIGLASKVFIIFFGAFVATVINSYTGVRMTNPTLIKMARAYGASKWEIFIHICIPSALPMVFGGLQVALSGAWATLVSAELVAANAGLGYLITVGRRLMKVELVMLGMIVIGFTGILISIIVSIIERLLVSGVRR